MSTLRVVSTDKSPAAIGPYSQAIVANGFVFASGQIPVNPETNNIVSDHVQEQVRQTLRNLSNVLEAANSSLSRVVKTTVYIKDMNDFSAINETYAEQGEEYLSGVLLLSNDLYRLFRFLVTPDLPERVLR
ncbi:5533_t:CDS:2 [Acaulospora morrowiae]|uniref:5533_t:CDS:1 n=1 Tax=Acaulospora morrowiae TaxID=94023 RepID=A0A9N9E3K9_9GLOM|nr:5533_t:CDS:2 [Acaulospora morrowiae]